MGETTTPANEINLANTTTPESGQDPQESETVETIDFESFHQLLLQIAKEHPKFSALPEAAIEQFFDRLLRNAFEKKDTNREMKFFVIDQILDIMRFTFLKRIKEKFKESHAKYLHSFGSGETDGTGPLDLEKYIDISFMNRKNPFVIKLFDNHLCFLIEDQLAKVQHILEVIEPPTTEAVKQNNFLEKRQTITTDELAIYAVAMDAAEHLHTRTEYTKHQELYFILLKLQEIGNLGEVIDALKSLTPFFIDALNLEMTSFSVNGAEKDGALVFQKSTELAKLFEISQFYVGLLTNSKGISTAIQVTVPKK